MILILIFLSKNKEIKVKFYFLNSLLINVILLNDVKNFKTNLKIIYHNVIVIF